MEEKNKKQRRLANIKPICSPMRGRTDSPLYGRNKVTYAPEQIEKAKALAEKLKKEHRESEKED